MGYEVDKEVISMTQELTRLIHEDVAWRPDYETLNYGRAGVEQLFKEFKHAATMLQYYQDKLAELVARRSEVTHYIRNQQASVAGEVDSEHGKQAKGWVNSGFAAGERDLLSKLPFAERINDVKTTQSLIQLFDDYYVILEGRCKQLQEFKQDARFLREVLTFANILQELT